MGDRTASWDVGEHIRLKRPAPSRFRAPVRTCERAPDHIDGVCACQTRGPGTRRPQVRSAARLMRITNSRKAARLQQHTPLHQLVGTPRVALAAPCRSCRQPAPQRGQHQDPDQDRQEVCMRLNIGRRSAIFSMAELARRQQALTCAWHPWSYRAHDAICSSWMAVRSPGRCCRCTLTHSLMRRRRQPAPRRAYLAACGPAAGARRSRPASRPRGRAAGAQHHARAGARRAGCAERPGQARRLRGHAERAHQGTAGTAAAGAGAAADAPPTEDHGRGLHIPLAPDSLGAQVLLSASAFVNQLGTEAMDALDTVQSLPLLYGWVVVMATNPTARDLLEDVVWRLAVVWLRRPLRRIRAAPRHAAADPQRWKPGAGRPSSNRPARIATTTPGPDEAGEIEAPRSIAVARPPGPC